MSLRSSARARAAVLTGALPGALLGVLLLATGCGPAMVERDGRLVFNPRYRLLLHAPGRDGWQRPDAVLDALALPTDAVVADVGAGSGYFTVRLAERLPEGRVLATDVQDPMLAALERRVARARLANVEVVRARFDDPSLPPGCCDLVFFSSVYKEISERVAYMRRLRTALRPGGRVAILEFLPGAPGAGPPAEVRLAPEQVAAELAEAGFRRVASYDVVPRESFQVFVPDERTAHQQASCVPSGTAGRSQ